MALILVQSHSIMAPKVVFFLVRKNNDPSSPQLEVTWPLSADLHCLDPGAMVLCLLGEHLVLIGTYHGVPFPNPPPLQMTTDPSELTCMALILVRWFCVSLVSIWFSWYMSLSPSSPSSPTTRFPAHKQHPNINAVSCVYSALADFWQKKTFANRKRRKFHFQNRTLNSLSLLTSFLPPLLQCCGSGSVCFWVSWIRIPDP